MASIKVFGHKSPDTDTTGSAVLWAWYLTNHTTTPATPFVLGDLNKETQFVLTRWGVPTPALLELAADDDVVVVDTNNPAELPDNINNANLLAVIDHHKLVGGLTSKNPPTITMRPLACTATLIYDMMGTVAEQMPKEMMGVMLSCILSDTLEFRSPTTTPHDKAVAEALAQKLGVAIPQYAAELFAAKSDVSDYSDQGLIHIDSKVFPVGGKNLRVSVVETASARAVLGRKEGIMQALKAEAPKGQDGILFFVVDILKEEATVFVYDEFVKTIVEKSFGTNVPGDTVVLPGIVSRKKQIIPALQV
ncbi:MAG: manganese-dependent inorganic pyrophosphatase [Patescibacteria group bacterium]